MHFFIVAWIVCVVAFSAAWLSLLPFKNRLHFSKWVFYGLIAAYCLGMAVIINNYGSLETDAGADINVISISLVGLLLLFGILAVQENALQYIFLLLTIAATFDCSQVLARMLSFIIKQSAPQIDYMSVLALMMTLVFIPTVFWLHLAITRIIIPIVSTTEGHHFWRYQWFVPLGFNILFRFMIISPSRAFSDETIAYDVCILLVWMAMQSAMFIISQLALLRTANANVLEQQLNAAKLQTEMQRAQYDVLQRSIERTRRTAHDLRHHFIVLDSLAESGDCDGIKKYLQANSKNFGEPEMPPVCDNYSVNSVLCHHIAEARKNGTEVKTNLQIPRNLGDDEGDVSIIISNLVENAVEACARMLKGNRFIEINAAPMGNGSMLAVTVKNSYAGEIRRRNGRFVSAKEQKRMGVGTESVKNMVEMRGGVCKYTYADGVFTASVLIKLDEEAAGVKA